MKKVLPFIIFILFALQMNAQQPEDYFITKWNVADYQMIKIPTNPIYTYNYTVDWGDGTPVTTYTGDAIHDYGPSGGVFTVKISGDFPQFYNNGVWNTSLLSVEQWGNIQWKSMARSFKTVQNMAINTVDNPDLSQVTDMSEMFFQSGAFNGDLSGWDVSNVINMHKMFFQCEQFNQDISTWNVGNVTDMAHMFEKTAFNQDIGNWDVSKVTTMASMFAENQVFNQDLGRWNINNVTTMFNMFNGNGSALSPANYDALLNGWSTLALPNSLTFNEPTLQYCNAEAAKTIILNKGWTIWDGGANCSGSCTSTTTWNGTTWTGGNAPSQNQKAIINGDYNTSLSGSINACSIQINPGFTLTVSPATTIRVQRDLAINGDLVFESDEMGNGELGILGQKAAIVGKATVQRYMKEKRSYRMVSSAVNTSTSIMHNWQEGVHNTSLPYSNNQNPNPGFGTHITGSNSGANGFDASGTGAPSMFKVNVANQQFQAVSNTDVNKLTVGEAYLMMVRGDRSIDLNNNNSLGETTLRATGKPIWGKKHLKYAVPYAGAFVMFGNPYQSAVDMTSVLANSANVNKNHYYIYDPSLGAHGAYVTVGLTNPVNLPASNANKYLQPGQGAQVATLSAGLVGLDFLEIDKAPGQFTSTNANGNTNSIDGMLMGQLYTEENYNNGGPVHDGFAILFAEENDNAITPMDAVKPMNFYENLCVDHEGTYLSLESRALPQAGETFNLYTNGFTNDRYVITFELNGLEETAFYLDDRFTGTSNLIEAGLNAFDFSIDSNNPESKASDRFSIRVADRLSVNDNTSNLDLSFYPNPMGNKLNIANPENIVLEKISIYDITGRLIKAIDLKESSSNLTLDVSNLTPATYMVVMESETGKLSKLLVKE